MKKIIMAIIPLFLFYGINLNAEEIPMDNVEQIDLSENTDIVVKHDQIPDITKNQKVDNNKSNNEESIINLSKVTSDSSLLGNPDKDDTPILIKKKNKIQYSPIELKSYSNIKYSNKYRWFEILPHDEYAFKEILRKSNVTESEFELMKDSDSSNDAIILNALYYDYVKKRPDIAENFYQLFPKKLTGKINPLYNRLLLSDYLLRTNRPKTLTYSLSRLDCVIMEPHYKNICWFYLGSAYYLLHGKSKNAYLRWAGRTIEKARILYNK